MPLRQHFSRYIQIGVIFIFLLGACSYNDGRVLQQPRPDQIDTISPTTTSADSFSSPVASGDTLSVTGPWSNGVAIDSRYTCDGLNVSPPLSWTKTTQNFSAYAVIMTDLDAPEFAHWVITNIDPSALSIPEDVPPGLMAVAKNSDGKATYNGPCPPRGSQHRYNISLYGLSEVVEAQSGDPAPSMIAAIEAVAQEVASTEFTYAR